MSKRATVLSCLVIYCAAETMAQTPLGADFTYQGQLTATGLPAVGMADFQFALFDALEGGSQIGATLSRDNVAMVDGLFTTSLDFGAGAFNGNACWIEVAVRSPAGAGGFTTLSPRQTLTATPQAMFAVQTRGIREESPEGASAHVALGYETSAGFAELMRATDVGNVGIGTINPAKPLHVRATEPVVILQDQSPAVFQAGYIGFWNNNQSETARAGFGTPGSPHFSIVNARTDGDISLSPGPGGIVSVPNGKVGIGTSSPQTMLDVNGSVQSSGGYSTDHSYRYVGNNGDEYWRMGARGVFPACGDANIEPFLQMRSPYTGDVMVEIYRDCQSARGVIVADEKNFRAPHPADPETDIWYCCPEGPEASMYIRGTGRLSHGRSRIDLPEHFRLLASEPGMTVHLTPLSIESKGLAVISKRLEGIEVGELAGGTGSYEFDWRVEAVRKGHENYQVLRPWMQSDEDPDKAWQNRLKWIDERRVQGKP